MTETPKCPYCGAEMMMEKYDNKEIYWYICAKCGCAAPMGKNPEAALSAALHRAEPENRPLTLEKVLELGKDEDSIVYIEPRRLGGCGWYQPCASIFDSSAEGQKNEIHFDEPGNDLPEFWPEAEYGKTWRCWPRKPTPEQMAAAEWEE
nr:MAG TPA: cysteine-rich protein [Caudoviricetes sp.]